MILLYCEQEMVKKALKCVSSIKHGTQYGICRSESVYIWLNQKRAFVRSVHHSVTTGEMCCSGYQSGMVRQWRGIATVEGAKSYVRTCLVRSSKSKLRSGRNLVLHSV